MKELFVQGTTLPMAYHNALKSLYLYGEISDCADYNQKQKECGMTICVEEPLAENRISKLIIGGHADLFQYQKEVVDGVLDFMIGHGWSYSYHNRIQEQYDFIINELKRNPSSRRAVINVRDWKYDITNDSPACLNHIQYFIRNGKLDCSVLFRSNDLPEATYFNMFGIIKLQEKIANELGVSVGTYLHRSNSMHCYEKDFKLLERYVESIFAKPLEDLTYNYEDFYKELMEETQGELDLKIKQLKETNNI
jgi:thymidylate synthase